MASSHFSWEASPQQTLQEKNGLRRLLRRLRSGWAREAASHAALSAQLCQQALGLSAVSQAQCVATYWPMSGEVDLRPLMTALVARGQTVALPVVVAADQPLHFRRWWPDMPLEGGPLHTVHPPPSAGDCDPDLVLVPLLAFDRRGFRLGYGGGFYDRTLAERPTCRAIGIAFSGQRVTHVPRLPHDRPLSAILCEDGLCLPLS